MMPCGHSIDIYIYIDILIYILYLEFFYIEKKRGHLDVSYSIYDTMYRDTIAI